MFGSSTGTQQQQQQVMSNMTGGGGSTLPAPPQTSMSPAPGPYSPYGNNPQPVQKPGLPAPPEMGSGGGVAGAGGKGNIQGPQAPNNQWQAQGPEAINQYGGQQIAGHKPGQADYNSVQGYADAAHDNARRYLDPQQKTQNKRMAQDLINQGIDPNSEQGQARLDQLKMQQADANNAAAFQSMKFGQDIQNQMFGQSQQQAQLAGQMQQALWNQQGQADQRNLGFTLGNMQNQLGYAGLQNQANIANQQTGLGYAGLTNQANIASMQDKTARYGADLGYKGQMAGIEAGNYRADLQHQLGMGQLDMARQGQDFNQMLGLEGIDFRNQQYADSRSDYQDQLTMAMMGMTPVPGATQIDPTGAFGTTIGSAGSNQGFGGRIIGI